MAFALFAENNPDEDPVSINIYDDLIFKFCRLISWSNTSSKIMETDPVLSKLTAWNFNSLDLRFQNLDKHLVLPMLRHLDKILLLVTTKMINRKVHQKRKNSSMTSQHKPWWIRHLDQECLFPLKSLVNLMFKKNTSHQFIKRLLNKLKP